MKHIILSCTILAFSLPVFADSYFKEELRTNCAKVKSYAASGKKFYDQKQYQKALVAFKEQASWSSFCEMNKDESGVSFSEQAISTAFNNVGLTHAKLGQYGWARAWFSVFPDMKSSQFNLQQLPVPTKPTNLAGKYVRQAGFGQWQTITVKRTKNAYEIKFNGLYMGGRSLINGPNIGIFYIDMPLQKAQAVYRVDDCRIDLKFDFNTKLGQHIQVNEINESDCGFGMNVSAEGSYFKVE
jgi:hypothetical protein